jgi:hypothetical protein
MKNKTKALLIPIAAFAVTVTGASAFDSSVLEGAGLDTQQVAAFEQAHVLRKDGDKEAARDILMNAGVDLETMQEVKAAMKAHHAEKKEAVQAALQNGDYDAFLEAVEGSPLSNTVDTPEEFALFTEAHDLREAGDKQAAREIMEELGFEGKMHGHGMKGDREGREDGQFKGFRGGGSE